MVLTLLSEIISFLRYLSFIATRSKFSCSGFISSKGVMTRASAVFSLVLAGQTVRHTPQPRQS